MQGRHSSMAKAECLDCGWSGLEKDMHHTYIHNSLLTPEANDVEPISYCSKCGSDNVEVKEELTEWMRRPLL